ncbi:hypothetical protein K438DRAFT_1811592 [Mycena galopus ATCC 62051]|nr:hypothetical protein K438DRAFT_1811592 [Mycena galopus ATCC 62051]
MSHHLPLDEALYNEAAVLFVKQESGISDSDALKNHLLAVQRKAYALHGFPCIRDFRFAKTQMASFPAYDAVLKLSREREGAILLDVGCCFGTDVRKVVRDGYPPENVIASDIVPDFWDIGHELFKSTPDTFPVVFLPGNALDTQFLAPFPPLAAPSEITPATLHPLVGLTSLTPLRGRISVIHISLVFHLFSEEQQFHLARSLAGLLSPLPGSLILGSHIGRRAKGYGRPSRSFPDGRRNFCHSPESWRALWEGIFGEGTVQVDAELEERTTDDGLERSWLSWCVTRI